MAAGLKQAAKRRGWREQLRLNEKRTRRVLLLFILLYALVGFLCDVALNSGYSLTLRRSIDPLEAARLLITLKLPPTITLSMAAIAAIAIAVTYALHDKLMLLGTRYKEVTADSNELTHQQLYNVVDELRIAAGLRYRPKVYIIEAEFMNAFASGYSERSAMVAITRGLMDKLTRDELQAVMAHELSHIRHHDIKLTLMASVLSNIMLVVVDILFYQQLYGGNRKANPRLLMIIMLLRYVLPSLTLLLLFYLSRTREFMADAGAVELTRSNQALATALLKIHGDYQSNKTRYQPLYDDTAHEELRRSAYLYDPHYAGLRSDNALSGWFSTHPTLEQRLQALGYTTQGSESCDRSRSS